LLFGTVSSDAAQPAHPVIRVVRQPDRTTPELVLWSWTVSKSGHFYAILQAPPGQPYLDEFYLEAGDPKTGFDRVLFTRLTQGDPPTAMYAGDLHITPATDRALQGQTVKAEIHDDFESAAKELKRLYPRFTSPIVKAPFFRNAPRAPASERR
jgi:hypothetical protein